MDLQWTAIPDTEGLYEARRDGVIRSLDRVIVQKNGRSRRKKGADPLRPRINEHGYHEYSLYVPGHRRKVIQGQSLILRTFVGPRPEGKPQIRHLDGNPGNNAVGNLAYATHIENRADMTAHGRDHYATRECCKWGHELVEPNLQPDPKNPNKRICRACNSAGSRFHAYKFDRELNPELFRIVSNWYLDRIMTGQVIYKVLKPPMFASMVALAERQKSALDRIPKPREEGE